MNDSQALLTVIHAAARLVPPARREEWLTEWNSEIWYALRSRSRGTGETLQLALGAFQDAAWVLGQSTAMAFDSWSRSPRACLSFLLVWAAVCVGSFMYSASTGAWQLSASDPSRNILFRMALQLGCPLLILPAVTKINLGLTFAAPQSPARRTRIRRALFTAAKSALLLAIALFGSVEFLPLAVQPLMGMVGCVLGFRWMLLDDRERCPICLRLLIRQVSVGSASRTFLDHYGTELCCDKGHGVMCEPEALTNYTAQRWSDSI